jgi:IS5 family transposase
MGGTITHFHHQLAVSTGEARGSNPLGRLRAPTPTYAPTTGAPGISTRLMAALHILKFQHDLSDNGVVTAWVENSYWQFFSGMQFFSHQAPIDPSSMTR